MTSPALQALDAALLSLLRGASPRSLYVASIAVDPAVFRAATQWLRTVDMPGMTVQRLVADRLEHLDAIGRAHCDDGYWWSLEEPAKPVQS